MEFLVRQSSKVDWLDRIEFLSEVIVSTSPAEFFHNIFSSTDLESKESEAILDKLDNFLFSWLLTDAEILFPPMPQNFVVPSTAILQEFLTCTKFVGFLCIFSIDDYL